MAVRCPQCRYDNRRGAKFCLQCGSELDLVCPRCGHLNPCQGRFCEQCGAATGGRASVPGAPPAAEDLLAKVRKYLPPGLAERILFQKEKIEGERRQVTVMFCDMHGFTAFVDRLGSEEAYQVMDRVYEILIHRIHEFEGTVNEMTGDGVMALFGAPIALEDAAQRALQSACAIHQAMDTFSHKLIGGSIPLPVKMRIGINTGPVVVGTLGNDLRVDFKAVGDTVNLAAHVEALATAGQTLVTASTFNLTEGLFEFETVGKRAVKGKTDPIEVYRVIAPSDRRTRFEVSAERGLTPFISREQELAFLLDRHKKAIGGQGQVFSIIAEAGVGKSRFVHEFKKMIAGEQITCLEGKCLSYSKGIAYYPISDLLHSFFVIRGEENADKIRERVKDKLYTLNQKQFSILPYVLEMLSVSESGIDSIPSSNETRRERMLEVFWRLVLALSESWPVVIIIEDLHWCDQSSESALRYLIDKIAAARVLLILTYRPEYTHPWPTKTHHGIINLNRFSTEEGRAMMAEIFSDAPIDEHLKRFVLEKAEGVPLFIEEFVRSLKKLGYISLHDDCYGLIENWRELTIPSTIQDLVMAKIDALPSAARELLQIGSVFESEFSLELLKHVSGYSEDELQSALESMADSELISTGPGQSRKEYGFRHAITKEVVYESILRSRRRDIHALIALAIESVFSENLEEKCEVLAHHYLRDKDCSKAAVYFEQAARKAMRSAALTEAISFNRKRIEALDKLPVSAETTALKADARTDLGRCYFLMNYMTAAKEAIDPIFNVAEKQHLSKNLAQLHTIMGAYYYMVEEKFELALSHMEKAVQISEETGDIISQVISNYQSALVMAWNCDFDRIQPYFTKAIGIFKAVDYLWGIAVMEAVAGFYAFNYPGRIEEGFKMTRRAVENADASKDLLSRALAYTYHGVSQFFVGAMDESEIYLIKGADLAKRLQLLSVSALAHHWLGYNYYETKDFDGSISQFELARGYHRQSNLLPSNGHLISIAMIRTEVVRGRKGVDLGTLRQYWQKNKLRLYRGSIARFIAEILFHLDADNGQQACEWINTAIAEHRKWKMPWSEAMDNIVYSRIKRRDGDIDIATQLLHSAKRLLKQCGADQWLPRIDALEASD